VTHVDRLAELSEHGVSIWLDSLDRGRLRGGGLAAVADHAQFGTDTIQSRYEDAATVLEALPRVGIDYEDVMSTL
jgi:transaldolase